MRRACYRIALLGLCFLIGCEKSETQIDRSPSQSTTPKARAWVTRKALEKATDDQLERVLLVCLDKAIGADYEHEAEIVRSWTPGKRMLYTTNILEAEVNNGGFVQFFWNTEGKFSQMALEGLKLIGAERHADLLQRAIDIHKTETALFSATSTGDLEAFQHTSKTSALGKLDDEFYDLTENLSALRVKFIRDHLDEFATPS